MKNRFFTKKAFVGISVGALSLCFVLTHILYQSKVVRLNVTPYLYEGIFNGSRNNETGYPYFIVPNIVHLIKIGRKTQEDISFLEAVTIRAAHFHQKPERILFHTNVTKLEGPNWDLVKNIPVLEDVFLESPTHIFGKQLSSFQHAADVLRIKVLMKYGGIYIDSDTYIIKSLDRYRKFEMSVYWPHNHMMEIPLLIAHPEARFLKMWLETYKEYKSDLWVYNSGILPTQLCLKPYPYIVHRVIDEFNFKFELSTLAMLYATNDTRWKGYDAIHVIYRKTHHRFLNFDTVVPDLDQESIKTYDTAFGAMARLVLYGIETLIKDPNVKIRVLI